MNRPVFNDSGLESAISFIADILAPFKRIVSSVFIVLSPLISIISGPARLIDTDRVIEKGQHPRIKK